MPNNKKTDDSDNLFSEFDPVTRKEWEELITEDLNGADYKKKLCWDTMEGYVALPFYMREDLEGLHYLDSLPGKHPYVRGIRRSDGWRITVDITAYSIDEANRLAIEAVEGGADSLYVFMDVAPNEGMLGGDIRGIPVQEQKDMEKLLDGIDLKTVSLCFNGSIVSPLLYSMFLNELERQNLGLMDVSASFYYDPFTWGARHGRWANNEDNIRKIISQLSNSRFNTLGVNGTFYHHCGATMVQELGTALAIGSEFLASAAASDISIHQAARSVLMRLSAGSFYFPEIAKFRAARLLWCKLVTAYDSDAGNDAKLVIHAETSPWNKTITDPYTNILRTTTEAMSAISGGADFVRIEPFDNRYQLPTTFSRRISRNIHHILKYESYFQKVADPAAGSYYVEQLTDKIASESWDFFKFLEKQGGFSKALEGRFLQLSLNESAKNKQKAIRQQKRILVGSNHYTKADDQLTDTLFRDVAVTSLQQSKMKNLQKTDLSQVKKAFTEGAKTGDVVDVVLRVEKQLYPTLEPWYAAEIFESIRIRTSQYQKKYGQLPFAVLLPIGNKKIRTKRCTFAQNYLGVAGYDVREYPGFDTIGDAAVEFKSLDPDIVVLCSSDIEYRQLVEPFCKAFKSDKKTTPVLILAGNPAESADKYRLYGIDFFICTGSDIVKKINEIHRALEERAK